MASSREKTFFLISIHLLLQPPFLFQVDSFRSIENRSFLPNPFPVKNKIENTRRGLPGIPRCIPTIPNDDESFVPRIEQPCLHARSTLKILDYPFHPVLSFSIFLRPISGTSLHPFQSSSTIGPRRKTFIFSRGQTYISFRFHAFQHALHFHRDSYHTDLNLKSSS